MSSQMTSTFLFGVFHLSLHDAVFMTAEEAVVIGCDTGCFNSVL